MKRWKARVDHGIVDRNWRNHCKLMVSSGNRQIDMGVHMCKDVCAHIYLLALSTREPRSDISYIQLPCHMCAGKLQTTYRQN